MAVNCFITDDFLLETGHARRLYHEYAEKLPIIDYHCHLPPDQIAGDHRWGNVAQAWLGGDHYKWRAMRSNGIPERYCTGDATDFEKFEKWAATMPALLRNPLYDWAHLELARCFGISDRLLGPHTARGIWDECNRGLALPGFSCRGLMKKFNVVLTCTTDDPVDSLEHHRAMSADPSFAVRVLPAWRPDRGMAVEREEVFNSWLDRLSAAADVHVHDFDSYMEALRARHAVFHKAGCRLSDHGLEEPYAEDYTAAEIRAIFRKIRDGRGLGTEEMRQFKSAMLYEFGVMDSEKGWVQQYHLGVMRSNNSRMGALLGPDTGFDAIGDFEMGRPLVKLLDRLDREARLPRTILYNINPGDNAVMLSVMGCFQDGSVPGKMQFGSAWWFLDQKDGMERQIDDLSRMGLLSRFIGMTTDSRSFLSYPRHEYFRRILCNILGREMQAGAIPDDFGLVGKTVSDICFNNAAGYFGFDISRVQREGTSSGR